MLLNDQIRKAANKCKNAAECRAYIQKAVLQYKYKTLYSVNYSDYDKTEFYKQIKAYKGSDEDYIVVITEMSEGKISKIKLAFLNEEPRKPHPLFPIIKSFLGQTKIYEFVDES